MVQCTWTVLGFCNCPRPGISGLWTSFFAAANMSGASARKRRAKIFMWHLHINHWFMIRVKKGVRLLLSFLYKTYAQPYQFTEHITSHHKQEILCIVRVILYFTTIFFSWRLTRCVIVITFAHLLTLEQNPLLNHLWNGRVKLPGPSSCSPSAFCRPDLFPLSIPTGSQLLCTSVAPRHSPASNEVKCHFIFSPLIAACLFHQSHPPHPPTRCRHHHHHHFAG